MVPVTQSTQGDNLSDLKNTKAKPDADRVAVLRSLPLEIKQQITGEEAEAFMYNRELPESLLEKLKDYLAPDNS